MRRAVIVLLVPVPWHPPGVDRAAWRAALAEDVVDLLATLAEVEPAIAATAADRELAEAVAWPGMPVYELAPPSAGATGTAGAMPTAGAASAVDAVPTVNAALAAAAADGFDQAAVIAGDGADVPGLTIGKLLRPLTTRMVAVSPAGADGAGLLGVASRLPAPEWLPEHDLDTGSPGQLRRAAPTTGAVAVTPAWRRLRGPADLATLDPAVEGWDITRALLGG